MTPSFGRAPFDSVLCLGASWVLGCGAPEAETIFVNGTIVTMVEDGRTTDGPNMATGGEVAEAFAVADGFFVRVDSEDVIRDRYPDAAIVDFGGAVVMPGIIESRGHMLNLGRIAIRIDLQGVDAPDEAVRLLRERAAETPPGEWIEGWGWDDGAWTDQMTAISTALNEASPAHPVWLAGLHGYNGWANEVALEMAAVNGDTPQPEGGRIFLHPETGRPSGVLANHAMALVTDLMPPLSAEQRERVFESAAEELLRNGLTSVHPGSHRPLPG